MSSLQFAKWWAFYCRKHSIPVSKKEEDQILSSKWSAFADQVKALQARKKKHGA